MLRLRSNTLQIA